MGVRIEKLAKTYAGVSVATVEDFFKINNEELDKNEESHDHVSTFDMREHLGDVSTILAKLELPGPGEILSINRNTARVKYGDPVRSLFVVYLDDKNVLEALNRSVSSSGFPSLTTDRFTCLGNLLIWFDEDTLSHQESTPTTNQLLLDENQLVKIGKLVAEFAKISQTVRPYI